MKVLYITYDGILDQLGGSKILPYIYGIEKNKNKVHILSFEKKVRYCRYSKTTRNNFDSRSSHNAKLNMPSIKDKVFSKPKIFIDSNKVSVSDEPFHLIKVPEL